MHWSLTQFTSMTACAAAPGVHELGRMMKGDMTMAACRIQTGARRRIGLDRALPGRARTARPGPVRKHPILPENVETCTGCGNAGQERAYCWHGEREFMDSSIAMQISQKSKRWSIAANRRRQKLREPHRLNLRNSLLVATKDACELFAFYASGNARNVAFGHRPMLGNGFSMTTALSSTIPRKKQQQQRRQRQRHQCANIYSV